jgi:hypothetical protein
VFAGNERALALVEEGRRAKQFKLGEGQYEDEILMGKFVKGE